MTVNVTGAYQRFIPIKCFLDASQFGGLLVQPPVWVLLLDASFQRLKFAEFNMNYSFVGSNFLGKNGTTRQILKQIGIYFLQREIFFRPFVHIEKVSKLVK